MNRNDRLVLIAAAVAGLLLLAGVYLLGRMRGGETEGSQGVSANRKSPAPAATYAVPSTWSVETFYFDPNTADSTQLLRLGLQPWQVRNIYKYRAHGGVYRKKEDFARLYGLTVRDYRRLEPYIRISPDYLPASTLVDGDKRRPDEHSTSVPYPKDSLRYPVKIGASEQVVLNGADTALLRKVPGIGRYYAKEIVRYGRWLGGYVSVDQLDEIDGFPQEAKRYFVIQHPDVRKLNVNRLSLQQLRRHPYINYYQAKTITDYRRLHGDIKDLRDLRFSPDFTEHDLQRLAPYVTY